MFRGPVTDAALGRQVGEAGPPEPPIPPRPAWLLTLCPSNSTAQLWLLWAGVTRMVATFWATSTCSVWLDRGMPGLGRLRRSVCSGG